jgi:glycosyltransferase involved in cell wall biosynthesis
MVVNSRRADLDRFFDHLIANATGYRRVTVIPNGSDPDRMNAATDEFRHRYGLENKLIVLNVANYSDRKNQEFAVKAFARAALPNAALVCIGSEFNGYSQRVQRIAREVSVADRVLLLERVSRELTFSAFKHCDVFVLSARAETQPVVIVEAMSCGKPWISTDTGCVRDFSGGYVVRRVPEMAERLLRLAADPVLRASLGAQGRKACLESYTWEKVGQRWEQLLAQLAGEGSL